MIVFLHATNCIFIIIFNVNGNAIKVFLLLNGTQYVRSK